MRSRRKPTSTPSVSAVLEADIMIGIACVAGLDLQLEVIALATAESDLHANVRQESQKAGYRPSLKLVSNCVSLRPTPLQRLPEASTGLLPEGDAMAGVMRGRRRPQ
jgi:hypothetical protein